MPESSSTSPANASAPEHREAGSLPSALLLALTGGSLDAFIYLNHGHTFAAAMTGNGVLLGVALLHRDSVQALHHLLPLLAFVCGILAAKALEASLRDRAVAVGLSLEIATLFAASWLPGSFPDLVFVPLVAIVAAYQITSFRKADVYSYNSTFVTGNLRSMVDGLSQSFHPGQRAAGLKKFRELGLIVLAFLAGALGGALLSPHLLNHTLWIIDLPLVCVLTMALANTQQRR